MNGVFRLKNKDKLLKAIFLVSDGYQRISDMKWFIKNQMQLKSYLNRLIELQIVVQCGNIFKMRDKLLHMWINYVFRPALLYSCSDSSVARKIFESKLREEYDLFCQMQQRESISRIIELFQNFKGDTLYNERKRFIRLPHLEKVRFFKTMQDERSKYFIVGEGRDVFIASLKESVLEESDVIDFQLKCTTLGNKNIKKCIITLDKYTDTAKLIASKNKISLWNKQDINFLLRTYNKPVIA